MGEEELFLYFKKMFNAKLNTYIFDMKLEKSDISALVLKDQANNFFKQKEYDMCIQIYFKAILVCIVDGEMHGRLLSNMSLAFYKLEEYEHCIKCIEACFKTACPNNIYPKLYVRKIHALLKMGKVEQVSETKNLLVSCLNTCTEESKEFFLKEANETNIQLDPYYKLVEDRIEYIFPSPIKNELFLDVTRKAEMKFSPQCGRYVVAKENIKAGEPIYVQKPFAAITTGHDCSYCLKVNFSYPIPCNECGRVAYCSVKCRDLAWKKFHKWECHIYQHNITFQNITKQLYLGLRVFLMGVSSGFHVITGPYIKDTERFGDEEDNFPYVERLLTQWNEFENKASVCSDVLIMVHHLSNTSIVQYIMDNNLFGRNLNMKNTLLKIGGHLLRLVVKTIRNIDECDGSYLIYPSSSLFNHACCANTVKYCFNGISVANALTDIECGAEITMNYLPKTFFQSTIYRKSRIRNELYFTCKCRDCTDPRLSRECYDSNLCAKCSGDTLVNDQYFSCLVCKHRESVYIRNAFIEKIFDLYLQYTFTNDIRQIYMAMDLLNKMRASPNHSLRNFAVQALYVFYLEKGNLKRAVHCANKLIGLMKFHRFESNRVDYEIMLTILFEYVKTQYRSSIPMHKTSYSKKTLEDVFELLNEIETFLYLRVPEKRLLDYVTQIRAFFNIPMSMIALEELVVYDPQWKKDNEKKVEAENLMSFVSRLRQLFV